ncbi:MAG TPA: enoyl-ACP reductase FabI [Acidimicrobiia bacterium]
MLLEGKRVLITGVLTDQSIAFSVARCAQEQGAEIVLTSFGRAMSLTKRVARKLPTEPDVLELDVTNPEHLSALGAELEQRWGRLDGVLHAIGFAPEACLGGDFLRAGWDDVATAVHTSAYSLKALAEMALPLMKGVGSADGRGGGSIVSLDFDATVAWPAYNWMGVAKAALESTCRYLARDLGPAGIRVNLVAAGPLKTVAAKSINGFQAFEQAWVARAPLGWSISDPEPVARACVVLLSDWFPATTGEMIHVDGGYHAIGA